MPGPLVLFAVKVSVLLAFVLGVFFLSVHCYSSIYDLLQFWDLVFCLLVLFALTDCLQVYDHFLISD